jgi:hypothetical protein
MASLIEVNGLTKEYKMGKITVPALNGYRN